MRKIFLTIALTILVLTSFAQKKILFDNTKSETAGNADWIIDNDQAIPSPAQSEIIQSTTEDYWQGALSSWGVEMVKRGYYVETLPGSASITYNNAGNSQDLSNYDIFVVCEPNNPFTSSEKQAMIDFVQNGGGLFIVADHADADRDGDGWDALEVWNDFFSSYSNPFGFTLDVGSNVSKDPATNVANLPSNTILHGAAGDVDGIAFYNGGTFSIDKSANSSVLGLVYYDGYSTTGNTGVMAVCATYGSGRVVGVGDSSVAEDETAHDASHTYPGWSQPLNAGDATGDDGVFMTNATIWLGESSTNPNILSSTSSLSGFTYIPGNGPSSSQSFSVSGTNLDGNKVTITAPSSYEVSANNSTFTSSFDISYTLPTLSSTTIYVRLKNGLTNGTYNETLTISDNGSASNINVSLSGEVSSEVNILDEDFTTCPAVNWTNYSVTSNQNWVCYNQAMSVNAYGGDVASNDWLISPAMDFSSYSNIILNFDTWTQYTDDGITNPEVKVKYSIDYPGSGNPEGYTWTELSYSFAAENSQTWTGSGNVDLSSISGTNIFIAFQYISSGTGAGTSTAWQIDNVEIVGEQSTNQYTISTSVNPTNSGTITGSGSYSDGSIATLTATANTGYSFVNWTENGSIVSTSSTYQFTVTTNRNLVANFTIADDTELLTNPYFTSGIDGWWAHGGDISTNNGEVNFNITDPGVNAWDIQLGQGNITLRQNYTYELCWRATRESGQIEFSVGLGEEPYTQYFSDVATGFNGDWKEHCITYKHTGEDVSNVALTVNLGGSDANATFDYISLIETLQNTVNVTFSVDMQNETVSNNEVYIEGSFNNWTTPILMQPNGDVYSTTLELEKNSTIEYNFKNGTIAETIVGTCATVDNGHRSLNVRENDISLNTVCFGSCIICVDPSIEETNPGPGPVSYYGEMQVNENKIYGERIQAPVQAKGMSFFWSLWGGEEYWTEGAVNSLVDYFNIELVRAPMAVDEELNNLGGYLHDEWKDTQIAYVEAIVDAAIARDIYVIIDYHSHYADEHADNAKEFFGYMAQKYGQYDNVIFEIYNEPIDPDWATIKAYAEIVIDTIREYSDNLILVGTEFYSSEVYNASLSPIADDNTAYVFHFYASYDGSADSQNDVIAAIENNVPVFASEWGNIYAWGEKEGLTDDFSFQQSDEWHALLDNYLISSANWCVYSTNMSSDSRNEAAIFNHESTSISRTGEDWNNTSLLTPSGLYMYNLLNDYADKVLWRKADYTNTVDVTFTVDMKDETVSDNGVFIHIKNYKNESDIEMTANESVYSVTLSLPVGSYIKYRFINGAEEENSDATECFSWDNYRLLVVPNINHETETVCFNSCSNCAESQTYTISAIASPTEGGTVTGGGSYDNGTTATLTATANTGYSFVNWTENGSTISTNATYQVNVINDRNLVANFDETTGITNEISDSQIRVFPNPSNQFINVSGLPDNENLKISVVNIDGIEIKQYMSNDKSLLTIDLSEISAGIYFINILGDDIVKTMKIIKKD